VADIEVTAAELAMAKQLIGSLEADFAPENYRDTHRDDLVALLNRKAAGEEIVMSVPEVDDGKVVDLLAALEASVAAAKAARAGSEPSATPAKKRAANKAAPAKTVAKKAPAKKAVAKRRSA
jgi:DNA end-binding protein Ku